MGMHYADEKYTTAVQRLSGGRGGIRERIVDAVESFLPIPDSDWAAEQLRVEHKEIVALATSDTSEETGALILGLAANYGFPVF